jgi:predicted nucleotidyltransferase
MVQKRNNLDFEIILLLIRRDNHIRGIAKNLEESHSTILRRLNDLVKENVIDYKLEGRNKVFFIKKNLQAKNYVFNAERYKQIKLLKKYPELSVIAEDTLNACHENLIIIFGSHAKFIAKKDSDIDVYVETKDRKVKDKLESIHSKINVKIGSFDLNSPLIKEIIKDHVVLKGVEQFYEKIKFFD